MQTLTRQSYQKGSLTIEKRTSGQQMWIFRWREAWPDGKRVQRKAIVGTKQDFPTKAKAEQAAAALRIDVTKEQPQRAKAGLTIEQLVAHYIDKELNKQHPTKAYSTRECYRTMFEQHILPRWGAYRLGDVRTVAVESWLGDLDLANASKAKVRNVFHALYSHAQRYEWHYANPITKVRQSAQRQIEPDILDTDELTRLLGALPEPFRTMVLVAAGTGLRRGELIGLQWGGYLFRRWSDSAAPFVGEPEYRQTKDGGLRKTCCDGHKAFSSAGRAKGKLTLQPKGRLGVCESGIGGGKAILARHGARLPGPSGRPGTGDQKAHRLAHLSAHLCFAAQVERCRCKGGSGIAPAHQRPYHNGALRSGAFARQAQGTNRSA